MSQLAVILDNLVKISKNFNGSGRKQAPTGKQQQVFHKQHRNASFTTKSISPQRPQRERGVEDQRTGLITWFHSALSQFHCAFVSILACKLSPDRNSINR